MRFNVRFKRRRFWVWDTFCSRVVAGPFYFRSLAKWDARDLNSAVEEGVYP